MTSDRTKFNKGVEKGLLDIGVNADRRKMDTVPMTALRAMTKQETLEQRVKILEKQVRNQENDITGLKAHAEALNSECNELALSIMGAMPWMILLGDYIGNGTKEDPMGRCNAILKMNNALGRNNEDAMKKADFVQAIEDSLGDDGTPLTPHGQAIAAGDGTLHGAIDHWQERALKAEADAFEMAAGQCCVKEGGLMDDGYGHQYCDMERQRDELKERAERAEAALEGARRDAAFRLEAQSREAEEARFYRYLRDEAGQLPDDHDGPMICSGLGDNFDFLRGEECDIALRAAIDAAMAREGE